MFFHYEIKEDLETNCTPLTYQKDIETNYITQPLVISWS